MTRYLARVLGAEAVVPSARGRLREATRRVPLYGGGLGGGLLRLSDEPLASDQFNKLRAAHR